MEQKSYKVLRNKLNIFLFYFQAIRQEFAIPSSTAPCGNGKKSDELSNNQPEDRVEPEPATNATTGGSQETDR